MKALLLQRWLWVTMAFAVLNMVGLGLIYRHAGGGADSTLEVQVLSPGDGVLTYNESLAVRFNQPMVAPDAIGSAVPTAWLRLEPPVEGTFTWLDIQTAALAPGDLQRGTVPSTAYALTVAAATLSLDGRRLGTDARFELETPRLTVEKVSQASFTDDGEVSLWLDFNMDVNQAVLERNLKVMDAYGKAIAFELSSKSEEERGFSVELSAVKGNRVNLVIDAAMRPARGGALTMGKPYQTLVTLNKRFQVERLYVSNWQSAVINVSTSQQVNMETAAAYIELEPKVKVSVSSRYNGFTIHGDFKPETSYKVTMKAGMTAKNGDRLAENCVLVAQIPALDAGLAFKTPGIYLAGKGAREVVLRSVNVEEVDVKLRRVYPNNLLHFYRDLGHYGQDVGSYSTVVSKAKVELKGEKNVWGEQALALNEWLEPNAMGAYLMEVSQSGSWRGRDSKLVILSDLGVTAKRSNETLLVWVNTLTAGKSVAKAKVQVLSRQNQTLAEGSTDADGLVTLQLPKPAKPAATVAKATGANADGDTDADAEEDDDDADDYAYDSYGNRVGTIDEMAPYAVMVTLGDDVSILELSRGALDLTEFGTAGRAYLREGYEAYVYTERGVYRPGESIYATALLRDADQKAPTPMPVRLSLLSPDGKVTANAVVVSAESGMLSARFDLPEYARTGAWRMVAELPGGGTAILGEAKLQVETFMPDRLKVRIDGLPEARVALDQGPLEFAVQGDYLYGAPAAGLEVEVTALVKGNDFEHANWPGYGFGGSLETPPPVRLPLGKKKLDDKGRAAFSLIVPGVQVFPSGVTLTILASVQETGGRAVTARASLPASMHAAYIGIGKVPAGSVKAQQELILPVVRVQPDGRLMLAAAEPLSATLEQAEWNTILEERDGRTRFVSHQTWVQVKDWELTLTEGKADLKVTLPYSGRFRLRLQDGADGAASAVVLDTWSRGDGGRSLANPSRLEMTLDKPSYAPGETARLLVRAPFAGRALLTVETDRLHMARVVEFGTTTAELTIPVTDRFLPNAWCSVTLLRGAEAGMEWASQRAFGVVALKVDAPQGDLQVALSGTEEQRPGRDWTGTITVTDAAGKGVAADVTVALVDEGVLSLTRYADPAPSAWEHAPRRLAVESSDLYAMLLPEPKRPRPDNDVAPGGGFAADTDANGRFLNPIVVRRVHNVSLWQGNLRTDSNGSLAVALPVPAEFTGSLRAMVVAATPVATGNASTRTTIREPLNLAPSLPRFLAPEDRCVSTVRLQNLSGKDEDVTVTVQVTGLELNGPTTHTLHLADGAGEVLELSLSAPTTPGKATVVIEATMAGETYRRSIDLAVRPVYAATTVQGVGVVKAGAPQTVALPEGWLPGTKMASLRLSTSPRIQLTGSLRYLMHYPYGCIEQTSSGILPLLYLPEIAREVEPKLNQPEAIRSYVDSGISRLLSMQLSNGAFAYWPGNTAPSKWGSIYATQTLGEAAEAGYTVPPDALKAALGYLESIDGTDDYTAYAQQVLALNGRGNTARVVGLYNSRKSLSAHGRYQVAYSLAMLNERRFAADILSFDGLPSVEESVASGGTFHSPVREQAMLLTALLKVNPESPHLPTLAARLSAKMQDGNGYTTQANATALVALGKYLRALQPTPPDFSVRVRSGETVLATLKSDALRSITLAPDTPSVSLEVTGSGSLFYCYDISGVPLTPPANGDRDLSVRRSFLDLDGAPRPGNSFAQGELVVVDLTITTGDAVDNIVISDLLPAGLEIENSNLATRVDLPWLKKQEPTAMRLDHVNPRDDRYLAFVSFAMGSTGHIRYLARAVTPGHYTLPAVTAECMYNPAIRSRSGDGVVEVQHAK